MATIKKLITVTIILVVCACSKPQTVSQVEAEKLAAKSLEEYAKKEKVSISQFGKPEVKYTERDVAGKVIKVWEVYYVSKDKPIRRVNILVSLHGDVELHQMVDKE